MVALQNAPDMDMERSAVLGTMVIEGFMAGSSIDSLHMYSMSKDDNAKNRSIRGFWDGGITLNLGVI